MKMHKLLMSTLLLAVLSTATHAGDKRTAYFGLELAKPVPEEMKSKVSGNILRGGATDDARWDSFLAVVKDFGNRSGVYIVESIHGRKTYATREEAEAGRKAIRKELVRLYNAEPGVRFKIDDRNDGVWSLTLRGTKLKLMVKRKLLPKKE